jgi:hypothetical protein
MISGNFERFLLDDFWISNNVWNRKNLVNGQDFTQSISFDPENLAQGITFNWDWGPDASRMLAFPEVIIGYKAWDKAGSTDFVSQIDQIETFDVSLDVTLKGDTDLYNVAYEIWTTDKPLGDQASITSEVMVWTHGADLGDHTSIVGQYKQGGYQFDIVDLKDHGGINGLTWDLVILLPRKDYQDVNLDMKAILQALVNRDLISGEDYISGYEVGSEVRGGKGSWTIDNMSHTFTTYNEATNHVVGTNGRDTLRGNAGDDVIRGAHNNDRLFGGEGADILTGGAGKDRFYFRERDDNVDEITDFKHGTDKIVLSSDLFPELAHSKHQFFDAAAHTATDHTMLTYNRETGTVYFDPDGAGRGEDPYAILSLTNDARLTWSDFDII